MIRDTSAQDTVLEPAKRRITKPMAIGAIAAVALVALSTWLFAGWRSSSHVANVERLRIVPVTVGTLVRDASVNGRVVAAVSPTLYAPAPATVTLKVHAGDTIRKGQVLAQLESPDLENAFRREQSSYEELKAEIARQEIIAQKQKLIAIRDADQAEIDRAAAQRAFERIEKVGGLGIAPGANIGDGYAIFEAPHGTAPKYADKDVINPGSVILSGVMMFRFMGWNEAADMIEHSMERTIEQKKVTYDFERLMEGATKVKTSEFATHIIENMEAGVLSAAH
jgi:hypothetical protein